MRVLVTASARFAITSNGAMWTDNPSLTYRFWMRYLEVYDEAHLLTRAQPVAAPPQGWQMVTGPGIQPVPAPYYVGPLGFARNYVRLAQVIEQALTETDAVQLRVACAVGTEVWRRLRGRPYGVEVVTDPYDVAAPGAMRHPLRPFLRWQLTRTLQQQCAQAAAAAYVTEFALQRRYPAASTAFSTYFSDVDLPDAAFALESRRAKRADEGLTLISVGTLAQLYKAPHILIDAVAECVRAGLDVRLILVGDGQYRAMLQAQAEQQGIGERVSFRGQLMGAAAVRAALDEADLFVLPSFQEGLPKAMIEAMARGLPCIGSHVGGFPELLPDEDRVVAGDIHALAEKIRAMVTDPQRMAAASARNLAKAHEYSEAVLRERRLAFYRHVRIATEAWLDRRGRQVAVSAR